MFGDNTSFKRKSLSRGELIVKEGNKLTDLFILTKGKVLNFSVKNGRVIPLYLNEDSGTIGEDCVLGQEKVSQYSSICLDDVQVIVVPRNELYQYINERSKWIKDLVFNISSKSVKTSKVIVEHQIKDEKLFGNSNFNAEDEKFILGRLNS